MFVTPVVAQLTAAHPETGEVVWTWSSRCNGDYNLGVTVHLNHKVLYQGAVPICQGSRDAEDGRVEFHFVGSHTFQRQYRTHPTDSIEGDIWQASGERDALVLGISFETKKQVVLNTLHIARPTKRSSSEIDKGLFVTTYPVPVREAAMYRSSTVRQ